MFIAMNRFSLCTVGMLGLIITVAGCGGTYDSSAKGLVTLDGTALSRGWVSFHPTSGGPAAYAPIDESGMYVMHTGSQEGLRAGDYQVIVSANEAPAQLHSKDGGPMPAGKLITPEWYALKDKSGLTASVKPGKNKIDFELTSKPPAGWKPATRK
jgi:hypothetical protein